MSQETDVKIGLSFLDEYEQEFKKRIGDYIAVREPIQLTGELGGPFNDTAAHFGMWQSDMREKLKIAENKLQNSNEGLAKLYFLRALHEAVLENRIHKDDYLVLVAFGSGFTWGSSLIKW